MASSNYHSTCRLVPCNDEVGEPYGNNFKSGHQDIGEEGNTENHEKAKFCRNHSRDRIGGVGYLQEDFPYGFIVTHALRPPTTQQWMSVKDMIYELYIERRFSLEDVKRELASQGIIASSRKLKTRLAQWGFRENTSKQDWQALAILRHRTFTAESQPRQAEFHRTAYVRCAGASASTEQNIHFHEGSVLRHLADEYSFGADLGPKKCREDGCMWFGKTLSDLKKHEAQHGFARRCRVEDCSRVVTSVNDLDRHKACVYELRESSTQVSRCLNGFQELEILETGWPRKDKFRLHMSKTNLIEDEKDHRTESLERWNDQHRALDREATSSSTNANIKKRQDVLAMLWHEGLEESPANHCRPGPTGFNIPSGRVMSHTERTEMVKIENRIASDPARDDGLTKDGEGKPLQRSDWLVIIMGQTGVGKSTFVNAFVNCLPSPSLEDAMHDEQLESIVPCTSTSWSVPINIRNGHRALHNDTRQLRVSSTSTSYHLQHDHLLSGTEDHAKRTGSGAVAVHKPHPPPARMSPDDDDDDESYGFHRAQCRLANRQREEWRAVIARVCDPLSRATEHEMGRPCKGTPASSRRAKRLRAFAEISTVETY